MGDAGEAPEDTEPMPDFPLGLSGQMSIFLPSAPEPRLAVPVPEEISLPPEIPGLPPLAESGETGVTSPFFSSSAAPLDTLPTFQIYEMSDKGIVTNCYSTGDVYNDSYCENMGGFVGGLYRGNITDCFSTGDVILPAGEVETDRSGIGGGYIEIGGFAGVAGSSIERCYALGDVVVGRATEYGQPVKYLEVNLGGFAGMQFRSIQNCYALGDVISELDADDMYDSYYRVQYSQGGFTGYRYGNIDGGKDEYNYAAGLVRGNDFDFTEDEGLAAIGGFGGRFYHSIGYIGSYVGSYTGSFFDSQTTGQEKAFGLIADSMDNEIDVSLDITGKATAEMRRKSTFTDAGWDFDTVWAIDEDTSYPYLQWQTEVADKSWLFDTLIEAAGHEADWDIYTPASYDALMSEIQNAMAVYEDENTLQTSADTALRDLHTALRGLVRIPDKSALALAIADGEAIDEADYTSESYAVLESALTAGRAVFEDENASQKEVDAAVRNIRNAIAELIAETLLRVQEYDENLIFSAGWKQRAQIGKFDEHIAMQASAVGESLTFTFMGDYFEILSYVSYSQGRFDIFVDGEKINDEPIDLYAKGVTGTYKITVGGTELPYDIHTVTLVTLERNPQSIGRNVYIDAVSINGTFVQPSQLTDDQVIVQSGDPIEIDVSANDITKGDILIDTPPASGTVQVVDNKIIFTPTTMNVKDETFTYKLGNSTATVELIYADSIRYEETFPAVVKSGSWESISFKHYSGGSTLSSSVKDDTITVKFYGTGIEIIGYKSWSRGIVDITVDGVKTTVDTFDMTYDKTYGQAIYAVSGLNPDDEHTLTIRVTGDRFFLASSNVIDIDAFVVSK
ncbi:MAG TPA: hypothetical protein DEQ02_04715 [Ruminococcaceae bacterium]|nr:hypothetical protein [Oscillospiraceae bacterium]